MDKRKILGVGTIAMAFFMSIVAVTVAFAAYSSDLKINGSATAKGAKWSVVFSNLQAVTLGNTAGVTSTAKETTAPEITGNTTLGSYKVELQTPGDYAAYRFKIENTGDFPARIDTGFAMPTPKCTKSASGGANDGPNVCKNLEYTLKYITCTKDATKNGNAVASGNSFPVGESCDVELRLYYKSTAAQADLPVDDVEISDLNFTMTFVQA